MHIVAIFYDTRVRLDSTLESRELSGSKRYIEHNAMP